MVITIEKADNGFIIKVGTKTFVSSNNLRTLAMKVNQAVEELDKNEPKEASKIEISRHKKG
jgi:hypothetical protein